MRRRRRRRLIQWLCPLPSLRVVARGESESETQHDRSGLDARRQRELAAGGHPEHADEHRELICGSSQHANIGCHRRSQHADIGCHQSESETQHDQSGLDARRQRELAAGGHSEHADEHRELICGRSQHADTGCHRRCR